MAKFEHSRSQPRVESMEGRLVLSAASGQAFNGIAGPIAEVRAAAASAAQPALLAAPANEAAVDVRLDVGPAPSVVPRAFSSVHAYRYNIVRERWGDDIELFFRFPSKAKTASFYAPAGKAALAARITQAWGGLSFKPVKVGNNWELKVVFGYKARLAYGGGYAPFAATSAEARSMAATYGVRFTT